MEKRSNNHLQGIDVSHWQGTIDWKRVERSGVAFAYIKATEGTTFVDPMLATHARAIKETKLHVGFYHFARFTDNASAQHEAKHFGSTVAPYTSDLLPALDVEVDIGLNKRQLSELILIFCQAVKKQTGQDVMLYTNTNFSKLHLDHALHQLPLWIAEYNRSSPQDNGIWGDWAVFQYSNKGRIPGISGHVDLDEMQKHLVIPSRSGHEIYKIKQGDTFWELENRWMLPQGALTKANPNLNPRELKIGQTIIIPENSTAKKKQYTIQAGDTFWGIEEAHHWKHGTLQALNPHIAPRHLQVGEQILVPEK
ncbi:hypothetical protein GCM10011391_29480 [Pullulanibacillus camelliae]|uniref:Lysozyme n=1 Tax=Pullulanibacillus camelliae TaxID=1707096 RepID=A0A8J2YKL7_9BACL|nr:GH25 family lysozyme [Pullulanibacillus camelliae]GGE48753.1 hypothetical protein GCM10011391_29480 [Pullulanibacillus camelliae]